jgi:hypothetical protein
LRVDDFYLFVAAKLPFFKQNLAFRDTKLFGEEFNQMGVSLAIYGGAVMATFSSSPCKPTMLSRLALG